MSASTDSLRATVVQLLQGDFERYGYIARSRVNAALRVARTLHEWLDEIEAQGANDTSPALPTDHPSAASATIPVGIPSVQLPT